MRVRLSRHRLAAVLIGLVALAGCNSGSSTPAAPAGSTALLQSKIKHVVVIYQENWSFDALYAKFPGANGAGSGTVSQLQWGTAGSCASPSYVPMTGLQQPLLGSAGGAFGPWPCDWSDANGINLSTVGASNPDPNFSATYAGGGSLPVQPYNLASFDPTNTLTGDIIHAFCHEQIQIDNGVLWSAPAPRSGRRPSPPRRASSRRSTRPRRSCAMRT